MSNEIKEQLILNARQMRSAPTLSERKLWAHLRKRQVDGFKFRRQHIIHTFIVDFYCPAAKLVVEVDGDAHIGTRVYDEERDDLLKMMGYTVVRVRNDLVEKDIDNVISMIVQQLRKK